MIEDTAMRASKCCWRHVAAAEAGHLQCLQGLSEAGRFLPLDSPDRASAGEARKLEFWYAAFTACKADHAHLLSWLFASGWPSSFDARLPWHMGDMLESRDLVKEGWPFPSLSWTDDEVRKQFMPELDLYRQAVRNPTWASLEALLKAGCHSVWICRLAAQEGKPAFLALAASCGCPCDAIALRIAARAGNLPLLKAVHHAALRPNGFLSHGIEGLSQDDVVLIKEAAKDVTEEGHAACLEALLEWFGSGAATSGISREGGLHCLDALQRAGCLNLMEAVKDAAVTAKLECLKYLLGLDPHLVEQPLLLRFLAGARKAAPGTIIDCMHFLQRSECQWSASGWEMHAAAADGQPEVLQYCLRRVRVHKWCWWGAMHAASTSGSPECMQVLYDNGYERHRLQHGWEHPAVVALRSNCATPSGKMLECLQLAVERSGKVDPKDLCTYGAFCAGDDVLRFVIELGAPLKESSVANFAAAEGRVELLREVLAKGTPLTTEAFEFAITAKKVWREFGSVRYRWAGSGQWLECLQCLCEHAHAAGLPEGWGRPSDTTFAGCEWEQSPGPSLPVLQYVCNHMGPTWADPVVQATARKLAGWARALKDGNVGAHPVDWQLVLYLARKMGDDLPRPLGELVAVRRERAAALAGAFFKAGQLAQQGGPSPKAALWDAMDRLPSELRERIALQAHLIFRDSPLAMAMPPVRRPIAAGAEVEVPSGCLE
eukprot:jgi/Botrbrau1/22101/Bobra.0206s0027.1